MVPLSPGGGEPAATSAAEASGGTRGTVFLAHRARAARGGCPGLVMFLLALALAACGPKPDNSRVSLPTPVQSTTIGSSDVIVVEIVGEKDLPREYQVASDGTVDLPYIHRVEVAGLEPQQVQEVIRQRLIAERVLTDPSVVVRVSAYNSKRVTVLGEVQDSGSFPFEPGLTLVQAISLAGGLNAIADADRIKLTRKTVDGSITVVISVRAIMDGRSPDIPLQSGDQIYVENRAF